MNWDAIGAVGESVGAALLFISIVYLAIQVRMAKQMMAVETAQRVRAEHHAIYSAVATNPELAQALAAETGGDPNQVMVLNFYFWTLSNWANQYDLYRQGLVDQTIMDATIDAFRSLTENRPSFRQYWKDEVRDSRRYRPDLIRVLEDSLTDAQKGLLCDLELDSGVK